MPRTAFTLVRQFNYDDAKTPKAEAIAREQDVFWWMDVDSHSVGSRALMRRVYETCVKQLGSDEYPLSSS